MGEEPVRQRKLLYAVWLGGLLWLVRVALVPARLRAPQVTSVSGVGPYYALVSWGYSLGARPVSVIVDLEAGEAEGSITVDGDAYEAEIPLGSAPAGPYALTASATYRILGFARTTVTRSQGSL